MDARPALIGRRNVHAVTLLYPLTMSCSSYVYSRAGGVALGFSAIIGPTIGMSRSSKNRFKSASDSHTSKIRKTPSGVNPAVWTVQPVGSCSPNSNVAALRAGDGTVLYGYYNMPFFFTLTAR